MILQHHRTYSILTVLLGKSVQVPNQPAVIHSSSIGFFAIRKGDWKLIEGLGSGGFTQPQKIKPMPGEAAGQLYNLKEDIGETRNLYTQQAEKVQELRKLLSDIKNAKLK